MPAVSKCIDLAVMSYTYHADVDCLRYRHLMVSVLLTSACHTIQEGELST